MAHEEDTPAAELANPVQVVVALDLVSSITVVVVAFGNPVWEIVHTQL